MDGHVVVKHDADGRVKIGYVKKKKVHAEDCAKQNGGKRCDCGASTRYQRR